MLHFLTSTYTLIALNNILLVHLQ